MADLICKLDLLGSWAAEAVNESRQPVKRGFDSRVAAPKQQSVRSA